MATTTFSGCGNLHEHNLKMYDEPKMNHWNTPQYSFLVSNSHEKLPIIIQNEQALSNEWHMAGSLYFSLGFTASLLNSSQVVLL